MSAILAGISLVVGCGDQSVKTESESKSDSEVPGLPLSEFRSLMDKKLDCFSVGDRERTTKEGLAENGVLGTKGTQKVDSAFDEVPSDSKIWTRLCLPPEPEGEDSPSSGMPQVPDIAQLVTYETDAGAERAVLVLALGSSPAKRLEFPDDIVVVTLDDTTVGRNPGGNECLIQKRTIRTALEAWKAEGATEGSNASGYPESLDLLVPTILDEVPSTADWSYDPAIGSKSVNPKAGGRYSAEQIASC